MLSSEPVLVYSLLDLGTSSVVSFHSAPARLGRAAPALCRLQSRNTPKDGRAARRWPVRLPCGLGPWQNLELPESLPVRIVMMTLYSSMKALFGLLAVGCGEGCSPRRCFARQKPPARGPMGSPRRHVSAAGNQFLLDLALEKVVLRL